MGPLAWKLFEPRSFGVLWRLYYVGIIDEIISHWQLTPSLVPMSPLKVPAL